MPHSSETELLLTARTHNAYTDKSHVSDTHTHKVHNRYSCVCTQYTHDTHPHAHASRQPPASQTPRWCPPPGQTLTCGLPLPADSLCKHLSLILCAADAQPTRKVADWGGRDEAAWTWWPHDLPSATRSGWGGGVGVGHTP